jgi:CheY-like chemotaxis protein
MTTPSSVRILLVDDSNLVRTLVKNRLAGLNPSWEISEARTGSEALDQIVILKPEVAMLDLSLPDMLGETLARQIRQLSPITKIVLCSITEERLLTQVAEHVGADAFISKTASTEEFRATLALLLSAQQ